MDKKVIIFGCGRLGHEAVITLGDENIECFCDNNPELVGKEKYGKTIISFDALKEKFNDTVILICADIKKRNAYAIARQCEENGISDYLFYESVRTMGFSSKQEIIHFLENPLNRMSLKSQIYMKKTIELQQQVDYFKRHADIRHIKPARGKLRERQLDVVKTSAEFLNIISDLEITPFLDNGSLLGYVRHNGFIPWDDDIDFGLMREEYEKLKAYCMAYMYTEEEFADRAKSDKKVKEGLENFYWSHNGGDEFNIYTYSPEGRKIAVDFLPLDYYAENYSFDELKQFVIKVREQLNNVMFNNEKRIACFQAALKENSNNTVKESDHIYFGIDNLTIMYRYNNGTYIPRDLVFPLKKAVFEGESFWIPNKPEEFLEHEYGNIWEFPNDVGIPKHVQIDEDDDEFIAHKDRNEFNKDTAYWNAYYQQRPFILNECSSFAREMMHIINNRKKADDIKYLLDLGCGNGRDSLFFAENRVHVVGIDASGVAIEMLEQAHGNNEYLEFICDDFVTSDALFQKAYDYCYSRFTLHAINERQEEQLLTNAYRALKKEGLFMIEARTIHDSIYGMGVLAEKNAYIYNDHYRRFIDPDELMEKVVKMGYTIIYNEEGNGFSKTETDDPVLLRLVLKK